jgi:hypothetical protein
VLLKGFERKKISLMMQDLISTIFSVASVDSRGKRNKNNKAQ